MFRNGNPALTENVTHRDTQTHIFFIVISGVQEVKTAAKKSEKITDIEGYGIIHS